MSLVDSVHGRVRASDLPWLDAIAAREGRPTSPAYKHTLAQEKKTKKDKKDGT